MSVFAIDIHSDKITVAGDTLAYVVDRRTPAPLGFVHKVFPLPRQRAVLFFRGMHDIAVRTACAFAVHPFLQTVEDVAEALPDTLRTLTTWYADQTGIPDWRAVGMMEAYLVGWSDAKGGFVLAQCFSQTDFKMEMVEVQPGRQFLTVPALPADYMPAPRGTKRVVGAFYGFRRWFSDHPELSMPPCGGEIIATTITREGLTTRVLHRFADYEQHRAEGAATHAALKRGDLRVNVAEALVPVGELHRAA